MEAPRLSRLPHHAPARAHYSSLPRHGNDLRRRIGHQPHRFRRRLRLSRNPRRRRVGCPSLPTGRHLRRRAPRSPCHQTDCAIRQVLNPLRRLSPATRRRDPNVHPRPRHLERPPALRRLQLRQLPRDNALVVRIRPLLEWLLLLLAFQTSDSRRPLYPRRRIHRHNIRRQGPPRLSHLAQRVRFSPTPPGTRSPTGAARCGNRAWMAAATAASA